MFQHKYRLADDMKNTLYYILLKENSYVRAKFITLNRSEIVYSFSIFPHSMDRSLSPKKLDL